MTIEEMKNKYRITKDLHTHTRYSRMGLYFHAKGTIMQNVEAAVECGLEEVAITDHGPKEIYGLNPKKLPDMRREIAEAQRLYPDIKIFLGVEANIMDSSNGLDISPEEIKDYDFINAGYHYGVPKCGMIANWITFKLPTPRSWKERMKERNTELALRALYNNKIRILTHPGDKAFVDIEKLAKACEETGTLVEINARHRRPDIDDLKIMANYAVDFIISSDAHKPDKVGRYVKSLGLALASGIAVQRIVNIAERK